MSAAHPPPPGSTLPPGTLVVHEMFYSIQGESTWAGLPCVFIRLTGCDLRCRWCDTAYAWSQGVRRPLAEVTAEALSLGFAEPAPPMVEVTGGEPLLQPAVYPLLRALCDAGRTVLLETNGAHSIARVDPRVHRIVDLKAPGSGECGRIFWDNIDLLTGRDEVKIVLASREDFLWAREVVDRHGLVAKVKAVLLSPVAGKLEPRELAEWILQARLPLRLQMQLHKWVWPPDQRGV